MSTLDPPASEEHLNEIAVLKARLQKMEFETGETKSKAERLTARLMKLKEKNQEARARKQKLKKRDERPASHSNRKISQPLCG